MTDFLDGYEDDELDAIIERQNERKKPKEIDIPIAFTKRNDMELPTEEQLMMQAMLNNVPNNTEIEKANHLAELENVAVNYSEEEWKRLLYHAPSHLMADEFKRRMKTYETFMKATRGALETLTDQKL